MRKLTLTLTLVALSITATTQESSAVQPYEDADAYEVYSLLLPHEESYAFSEDMLMIQENAVAQDISGAWWMSTASKALSRTTTMPQKRSGYSSGTSKLPSLTESSG